MPLQIHQYEEIMASEYLSDEQRTYFSQKYLDACFEQKCGDLMRNVKITKSPCPMCNKHHPTACYVYMDGARSRICPNRIEILNLPAQDNTKAV